MKIFLADKQDITRAGLSYIISDIPESVTQFTEDKSELLEALKQEEDAVSMGAKGGLYSMDTVGI